MLCTSTSILISLLHVLLIGEANSQGHDVRLSGTDGWRGRVEVMNDGQWGRVCADGWDFDDALVLCKQLGFPWVHDWSLDLSNGTGPTWLRNVRCKGSEARLDECAHDGWMEQACSDVSHPASVECVRPERFKDLEYSTFLSNGDGLANDEGTVVLDRPTGEYGRRFLLCDQDWDLADATVICRQRGRPSALRATTGSYFGRPRPNPYIDLSYLATGFQCVGNESHILQCPARGWFEDDCPSGKLAGVICNSIEAIDDDDDICRQLGQGYGLEAPTDDRFGRSSGPVARSGAVSCAGGESSFAQCYVGDAPPNQACLDSEGSHEVGVICSGPVDESRSPVRLSSTKYKEIGRVMIYHDGRWGTICNKNWTRANAIVVCRELGLYPPEEEVGSAFPGDGPINLGQVSCKGDELTLDQCQLGEWNQHDCGHTEDVQIHCSLGGAGSAVSSAMLLIASFVACYSFVDY